MKGTARYLGGPLDGDHITPLGARWAVYRDDTGAAIPAGTGDEEWSDNTRPPRCYYLRQPDPTYAQAKNPERHVLYVHATLWHAWEAEQYNPTGRQ